MVRPSTEDGGTSPAALDTAGTGGQLAIGEWEHSLGCLITNLPAHPFIGLVTANLARNTFGLPEWCQRLIPCLVQDLLLPQIPTRRSSSTKSLTDGHIPDRCN